MTFIQKKNSKFQTNYLNARLKYFDMVMEMNSLKDKIKIKTRISDLVQDFEVLISEVKSLSRECFDIDHESYILINKMIIYYSFFRDFMKYFFIKNNIFEFLKEFNQNENFNYFSQVFEKVYGKEDVKDIKNDTEKNLKLIRNLINNKMVYKLPKFFYNLNNKNILNFDVETESMEIVKNVDLILKISGNIKISNKTQKSIRNRKFKHINIDIKFNNTIFNFKLEDIKNSFSTHCQIKIETEVVGDHVVQVELKLIDEEGLDWNAKSSYIGVVMKEKRVFERMTF
jgi:hypothetical protein